MVVGVGALADGAVERHPQVPRAIHGRPVGVLVVIAGHPPALGVCEIFVGASVGIGIAQPRQFAALYGVEIALVQREPERFVQSAGEPFVNRLAGRELFGNPHLAFANRNCQAVLRQCRHAADLELQIFGEGDGGEFVIILLSGV